MEKKLNLVLFDDINRNELLPLTFTKPVSELRIGIDTLREKWEHWLGSSCSFLTAEYLSGKFQLILKDDNLFINAAVIPDDCLRDAVLSLKQGELIRKNEVVIAYRSSSPAPENFDNFFHTSEYKNEVLIIRNTWDLFSLNDRVLRDDFRRITFNRKSQKLSSTNQVLGGPEIFLEEGVRCECAVINAETGPVYLGKDAEVMEGALIRGPFALCEQSTLKMGAKIYGATTIGPFCKVGGEVNNCIFSAYSNKAHDGFLGNTVIGEWCNLGADSNNSNLKNTYAKVKLWSYTQERFVDTGLKFCGLIMGDHTKCSINTMFNTGTVVGVSANIFGAGFPRNFIPSFSWGGTSGTTIFKPEMALTTAREVMARRNVELTKTDEDILMNVFEQTKKYRVSK